MSRQDKATTERHARILREMVKQPDNKSCADCRKNDARWASWNLGCFLCIRCSGIHRSMGTHISKVKSIDLDIWTPEQMEHIQKWGNKRANMYWERHLKAGHIPHEHKIESFIRSKYESRRWAMDGEPPSDPSVLDNGTINGSHQAPNPTSISSAPPPAPASLPKTHPLLSKTQPRKTSAAAPTPAPAPIVDLFGDDPPAPGPTAPPQRSTSHKNPPVPTTAAGANPPGPTPTAKQTAPPSNLFDLDFKAPTMSSKPQTAKADILSLYSSTPSQPVSNGNNNSFFSQNPPPQVQNANPYGSWSGGGTSTAPVQHSTQTALPGWGMEQNAWGSNNTTSQPQAGQATMGGNVWGSSNSTAQQDPWNMGGGTGWGGAAVPKKDDKDPFANIWQ